MYMIQWAIYGLVYLGSLLMIQNICGFVRFARYIRKLKTWRGSNAILHLPIILLVLFLLGYLAVGVFGQPDMIVAGILFGGSVFVFAMYKLLNGITQRILESEQTEAKLLASEEASRAKLSFLASVSHEMRTPMNVILGLDSLALNDPALQPETRRRLEKIGQSGRHLLGLINNVLDMNDIEASSLELKNEVFCLRDALDQVNAIAHTLCEEKGLDYQFSAEDGVSGCYTGDVMQLKKLLLTLLDNAVKYTDAPGCVRFSASRTDDGAAPALRFAVADTGVGISEDFLPTIFEPFTQEDASATNRYGGSGLALAVAKETVELMGGSIMAESEKNRGSVFTLTVPLPAAECVDRSAGQAEEAIPLEGLRVLIVEDIPENAEILQDILELEGVEADRAENGSVSLEIFEGAPLWHYDAILMDIRMPVMDGFEATRRIRALDRPDAKAIPIIAVTANAFESDVKMAMDAGMNEHLAKPADADTLYAALRKWVRRTRQ